MTVSTASSSATPPRPRVLFISGVPLQAQLIGPAIRCLELARQVSQVADVTITASHAIERETPGLAQRPFQSEAELLELVQAHDAFVAQGSITLSYPKLLLTDRVKIFDLYVPVNLELLEHGRQTSPEQRQRDYRNAQATLQNQLAVGDFFLCANDRQRDYYLGMLARAGRINPITYDVADRSLRNLLVVVPLGLSAERPTHTRSVLRGVHPAIAPQDVILIWAGSLLDWLDPLTLIRAMSLVRASRSDVKLFFLASTHPTLSDSHAIANRAATLSRELELLDRTVIFNPAWTPYDERANYLLEADIGVTTHPDHLETHFSFRTRVLDYLWAGLPLISSTGDAFSELIQQQRLGLTVPPGEVEALAQAILKMAADVALRQACRANVQQAALAFRWDRVAQPLVEFCRAPRPALDRLADRAADVLPPDRISGVPIAPALVKVQSEIRRVRRSPQARIVARFKTTVKHVLRRRYTTSLYDRTIEAEGPLLSGRRCGQVFHAPAQWLNGIEVFFGTFGRVNTCDLVLHVCDSPQATTNLAVSRINAWLLSDCDFCVFEFSPIANSAGREFYFWLESPNAILSDCVTVFRYDDTGELVFAQRYA